MTRIVYQHLTDAQLLALVEDITTALGITPQMLAGSEEEAGRDAGVWLDDTWAGGERDAAEANLLAALRDADIRLAHNVEAAWSLASHMIAEIRGQANATTRAAARGGAA